MTMLACMNLSQPTRSERRRTRSTESALALRYQLQTTARKGHLAALVLADADGLLVEGIGNDQVCHEFSAVAPILYQSTLHGQLPDPLRQHEFQVQTVRVHGETMYLIAVGPTSAHCGPWMAESAMGVTRILTQ
jgi:hypothetical protein